MVRYCSYKVNYCLHRQDSGALVSASLERNVNPAADRKLQCHIPTDWLGRHIIVIHARVFDSKFFFFEISVLVFLLAMPSGEVWLPNPDIGRCEPDDPEC